MTRKYDPNKSSPFDSLIANAESSYNIPAGKLRQLIWYESDFNPQAKSETGARGLAQFVSYTGNVYGLKTHEDFMNPQKSVDAAARHLADLQKKYGDDWDSIYLAYNQGEGKSGRDQLAALKSGNLNGISPEGRKYIAAMRQAGGGVPEARNANGDAMQMLSTDTTSVGTPQAVYEKEGSQSGFDNFLENPLDATAGAAGRGLKSSPLGTSIRAGLDTNVANAIGRIVPSGGGVYVPDAEDRQTLIDSGIPAYAYNAVMKNANSREDFQSNLKTIKANLEAQQNNSKYGFIGSVASGLGDAIGDPTTYIPTVGVLGKASAMGVTKLPSKILNPEFANLMINSAGQAALSEALFRNSVTGQEEDIGGAVVGSLLFTAGLHGLGKAYKATANRVELAETARNMGKEDPTIDTQHDGSYKMNPEEGTVTLPNGKTISDHNPAIPMGAFNQTMVDVKPTGKGVIRQRQIFDDNGNIIGIERIRKTKDGRTVKTVEKLKEPSAPRVEVPDDVPTITENGVVRPKAASSGRFFLQDMATVAHSADSPELRDFAAGFASPTQGYENGAFGGRPHADAETILRQQNNQSAMFLSDLQDSLSALKRDPKYMNASNEEIGRAIRHAVEGYTPYEKLTKLEKQIVDNIRNMYRNKADDLTNPSKFGNPDAPSLMAHKLDDTYFTRAYDQRAILHHVAKYGKEMLQELIGRSWHVAYRGLDEAGKKRFLEFYNRKREDVKTELTDAEVAQFLKDEAYGIVNGDELNSAWLYDAEHATSAREVDFVKERIPLPANKPVYTPDGEQFSVDDLVSNDISSVLNSYLRTVNGDVALAGSFGKSPQEIADAIRQMKVTTDKDLKARSAMQELFKATRGQARRDTSTADLYGNIMTSMSYALSSGKMWIGQMFEGLANGNMAMKKLILNNFKKELLADYGIKPKKGQVEDLASIISGKVMTGVLRPDYNNTLRMTERTLGESGLHAKVLAGAKYAADMAGHYSPFSKALGAADRAINSAANETVMSELINAAIHGGKTSFGSDKWLKSVNLPKDVYENAVSLLRDALDNQGNLKIDRDAFRNDPRSIAIERIMQKFSDEMLMKQNNLGQGYYKPLGMLGRTLMQFKRFAVGSSQYLSKTYNDVVYNQRYDKLLGLIGNMVIGGYGSYLANTLYTGYMMPEELRKDYFRQNIEGVNGDYAPLAVAGFKRSPILAAPSLIYDTIGSVVDAPYAGMGKTTYEQLMPERPEKTRGKASLAIGEAVTQNVPAVRPLWNIYEAARTGKRLATDDLSAQEERNAVRYLYQTSKTLFPNDPTMQAVYRAMWEAGGVNTEARIY